MKVLILQEDFPPQALGGAGGVVASLAREYARLGHEVMVVTAVQDKSKAGSFMEGGMRVERFYSSYHARWRAWRCLYNPAGARAVEAALKSFKPDVVHAHNVHEHLSYRSLVLAKQSGAKVLLTAHDVQAFNYGKLVNYTTYKISPWRQFIEQRFRYNPFRNLIIRYVLRRYADRIVAVSAALKDALEANGIGNVEVVRNGMDTNLWSERGSETEAFKQKHRIGERAILFSGGSYLKGAKQLLDAFALVRRQMPDAQLVVVGRNAPQGSGVVSAGWVSKKDELRAAYHAAAVVAVPSICFDSFPTINLEAMAAGKPVVATNLGGSREAVEDGKTGYIVDPFDTPLLVEKLADLLADAAKAKEFGEAGRARVAQEFTLERQAHHCAELFNQPL